VEASELADAHRLAAGMVVFALVVLVTLYRVNRPRQDGAQGNDRINPQARP
jgi:molybdate transport system permease protein